MKLRHTCKEVAALLVAREDRALPLLDQVTLRLHLVACDACPNFERQLLVMRRVLQRWRQDGADDAPPP